MMESQIHKIEQIAKKIAISDHLVVFTGAGISTASGLPDYRGSNGIWTLKSKGITSRKSGKPWYEYEPNSAHKSLVELQNMGLLKFVISQNVDGLHIKSGIKKEKIAELHGNATLLQCVDCHEISSVFEVGWNREEHGIAWKNKPPVEDQPICPSCSSRLVTTIVNFGDALPRNELDRARYHSKKADLFMVVGSSLTVFPAASFPRIAKKDGAELLIINLQPTKMDRKSDLVLHDDVSNVLPMVIKCIKNDTF